MTTIQDLERRLNRVQAELAQVKSNDRLLSFRLDNTSLEGNSLRVKAGVTDAIRTDGAIVSIANRIARIGEIGNFIGLSQSRQSFFVGGTEMLRLYSGNQDVIKFGDGSDININFDELAFIEGSSGKYFIGKPFSNSKMLLGLTISQGVADGEILAFRSSDVNHGITDWAETGIFGTIKKVEASSGGLRLTGYKDADGTPNRAVQIFGRLGEAAETIKTVGARGVISISAQTKSGTDVGNVGADGNLVAIQNFNTTRWILDAEGTAHHVPDSDEDIDLIAVRVTGIPTIGWRESPDIFNFSKGANFAETVYINDTANTFMDTGLTIDQAGADNEIIALKSSIDITHGMTSLAETGTFGTFRKELATTGGLRIAGYSESTRAVSIHGKMTTDITTKTTSSRAAITFVSQKKSGTSAGNVGADGNLAAFLNSGTTRWILNAEGDQFYGGTDGGSISDRHDDAHLLSGFRAIMSPSDSPAHRRFKGFIRETEGVLVQQGVLTAPLSKGGLVSDTGLKGLLIDAIIQLKSIAMQSNDKIVQLTNRITQLEAQ